MSRKKVGVFCLFLFFTFFIIVPKVEATEEMKTKFTVTPVLPENQVSGTSSYYDLILAPKQSSTIVLDIKNKTDEKLSIVLTLARDLISLSKELFWAGFMRISKMKKQRKRTKQRD